MRLTVLSIAYPFAPTRPNAVGGAERILSDLDAALVERGHVSLIAACEGSNPAGELFAAHVPEGEIDEAARRTATSNLQAAIDRARETRRIDLIHMHGFDFHQYRLPENVPALVTLHLPPSWYPAEIWRRYAGRVAFQFVSESQRGSAPPEFRDAPVIANGVSAPALAHVRKRDFAVAMGRICPEKNQHAALEAAARAGVRVLLAGHVFPYAEHVTYFHEKVEPLLSRGGNRFLGPLAPQGKWRVLASARCLLHPTLAPETSSLVAIEALAAGTPVIAYPSGALPEIVEHGVNGFLAAGVEEMAAAIANCDRIQPEACRRTAHRFSLDRMVRSYFALYEKLAGEPLRVHA